MGSGARYGAVVFDLDGTIVDSVELIIVSFQHAIRAVLGREAGRDESIANVGRPLREQMAMLSPEHADELVAAYREFNHREHDRMLTLYDGILNLLHSLQMVGVKLGLVTSKSRYTTQMAFDLTGIESYFDAVDLRRRKPSKQAVARPYPALSGAAGGRSRVCRLCGRQSLRYPGRVGRRRAFHRCDMGRVLRRCPRG